MTTAQFHEIFTNGVVFIIYLGVKYFPWRYFVLCAGITYFVEVKCTSCRIFFYFWVLPEVLMRYSSSWNYLEFTLNAGVPVGQVKNVVEPGREGGGQLRRWRHWRNGRIRANAFLSESPHPGTISALPLRLFLLSKTSPPPKTRHFSPFLLFRSSRKKLSHETPDKCHICMFNFTRVWGRFERIPKIFNEFFKYGEPPWSN